jgi:hypothetical protein
MVAAMSDDSQSWARLFGGPCDGQPVWVTTRCWAVVVTRDSNRRGWFRHTVEIGEEPPVLAAVEAGLYLRNPYRDDFAYRPGGLERGIVGGQRVWRLSNGGFPG